MLLTNRIASIPYSPGHSPSHVLKDVENPFVSLSSSSIAPSLQYFNMRVNERLHRYRSLRRQWNEVTNAIQIETLLTPQSRSPSPIPDGSSLTQALFTKEYLTSIIRKEKTTIESDPLHFQIEKDLIQLRKLIKVRQKKHVENVSTKIHTNSRLSREATACEDQEKSNIRKILSLNTLHQVKISGSQMRPSTYPQADSLLVNTSNSLSTSSQYFREPQQKIQQKNIKKIFSVYRNRVSQPLPTDVLIQGVSPPKKKTNTLSKPTSNANEKQTQSYRLSMLPIIKKKQSNFIKQETPLPSTRRPSIIEQTTTCPYTYAASSSSAIPCSMKLNRNTSLLPILLTSSSCLGTQPRKSHSGKCDNSNNLLDYKHLITHLPKPLVSIHPRYDQGEYGYLFKQLDHIRDNMPNSNVYQNYTRIG